MTIPSYFRILYFLPPLDSPTLLVEFFIPDIKNLNFLESLLDQIED